MMFHAAPAAVLSALKRRKSRKLHKVFAEGKNVNDEDSIDSECIMSGSLLYEDSDIPDFLLEVLFSSICYRSSLYFLKERERVCVSVYTLYTIIPCYLCRENSSCTEKSSNFFEAMVQLR